MMVLAVIALFVSGVLAGYRLFTVGPPSAGCSGWVPIGLLIVAGVVMMVIGNPLWPNAILKLIMSPLILAMGWGVGNRLALPADESSMLAKVGTQTMLRGLITLSVLLAILVALYLVLT